MLVTHGVSADLEGEDLAVADDVEREMLSAVSMASTGLPAAIRPSKGRRSAAFFAAAGGKDVDGTAAVVGALQQALVLEIGDVFVHGGERTEAQSAGDLLVGGRVAILLREVGKKVDDLFLPPRNCHAA